MDDSVWLMEKARTEEQRLQSIQTQRPGDTENTKAS